MPFRLSFEQEVSRFLKQGRPDLLPRNDIGGILLVPGDAIIKPFPQRIEQLCLLRGDRLFIWLRKSLICP